MAFVAIALSAAIVLSLGLLFEAKWAANVVATHMAICEEMSATLKPTLDKVRKASKAFAPIFANVMLGIGSSLISVALTIIALQREGNTDAMGRHI
jgi:hypothetical protein